ncbi:type II toxin-antitoxin system HicB family antitoxin [Leuconostoc mesenteroides]|uniref:type II toxin-antitoxin system HicB family antitoxin n=1 Tax=Leuconostoc mesenteroides TaxID=1245 RepID=UPI001CBBD255|nr:type II toxin-antitoxin system HicB family antitoxin [Leuconostoc mesenteroides]MBZ1502627.1 type II toxin-antitoxin system HicB family antitoxin [Leuconostoc mesenteroides]
MRKIVNYPVIATAHKNIVTVSSPNIPGMHTEGKTSLSALVNAIDAIEIMLEGEKAPDVMDVRDWQIKSNQIILFVPVRVDA